MISQYQIILLQLKFVKKLKTLLVLYSLNVNNIKHKIQKLECFKQILLYLYWLNLNNAKIYLQSF